MIIAVPVSQQFQEIYSTFAVGTFKPGKPFIANMGAVTVFTLVPCTRIVNIDMGGILQTRSQYALFFLMIQILIFRYNVAQMPF